MACCNSAVSSACALRNILRCLDNLNQQDLATLRDIINRMIDCDS